MVCICEQSNSIWKTAMGKKKSSQCTDLRKRRATLTEQVRDLACSFLPKCGLKIIISFASYNPEEVAHYCLVRGKLICLLVSRTMKVSCDTVHGMLLELHQMHRIHFLLLC